MESVAVKKQPMDKLSPIEFPPFAMITDGVVLRLSSNFRFLLGDRARALWYSFERDSHFTQRISCSGVATK